MILRLIIIYTNQLFEMNAFYETIGLHFELRKYSDGPEHFVCRLPEGVQLELYPPSDPKKLEDQNEVSVELVSPNIDKIVENLIRNGWQDRLVLRNYKTGITVLDPDNNKIFIRPKATTLVSIAIA